MTQHGHDPALDAPIDLPSEASTTGELGSDGADPQSKDESVVDKLLKEGSDAPDAADIEDPATQI